MSIQFGDYTPPKRETKIKDLTIGIFFDGTNNNKNNTNAKAYYEKEIKGEKLTEKETKSATAYDKNGRLDEASSYHNAWSNVARLWHCYPEKQRVYIDGIGTETEKTDSLLGAGFGTGDTGILGRVLEGCKKLAEIIPKSKTIPILYIDIFGFSRGAATARCFLNEISKGGIPKPLTKWQYKLGCFGYYLKEKGVKVTLVKVRFLGLFDTVSSYSKYADATPDFSDDTKDLELNNISKAKNIVHFTAMDEHRENFSLTKIHSGNQKVFPGVHSDVGGSYGDGQEIVQIIDEGSKDEMKQLSKKLIEECWYNEEQLEISTFFPNELKGTRKLKNTYSYVPLHLMAESAILKDVPFYKNMLENSKYKISNDPLLMRVKERLRQYVFGDAKPYAFVWYGDIQKKYKGVNEGEKRHSDYEKELQEQKDLRNLRNNYLHWSADKAGIGMEPTSDRKRLNY